MTSINNITPRTEQEISLNQDETNLTSIEKADSQSVEKNIPQSSRLKALTFTIIAAFMAACGNKEFKSIKPNTSINQQSVKPTISIEDIKIDSTTKKVEISLKATNAKGGSADFGDGTVETFTTIIPSSLSHQYKNVGTYTLVVTVNNGDNQAKDTKAIELKEKEISLNPTFTTQVDHDTITVTNTTPNLPVEAVVVYKVDGQIMTQPKIVVADGNHTVSMSIIYKGKEFKAPDQIVTTKKKEVVEAPKETIKYIGGNKDWPYVSEVRNGVEYYKRFVLLDPDKDLLKSPAELKAEGKTIAAHILEKYNSIIVEYSLYHLDRFDNFQELIEHMKNGPQFDGSYPNRLEFGIRLKQDLSNMISVSCDDATKAKAFLKNITFGDNIKVEDIYALSFAVREPMFQRYGITNTSVGGAVSERKKWVTSYYK